MPAQVVQDVAAVVQRFDEAGPDLQRLLAAGKRLVVPPQGLEDIGVVIERLRRARIDRERLPDQALGLGLEPEFRLEHAQQMQSIETPRLRPDDPAVHPLGFLKVTPLVRGEGALQRLAQRHAAGRHDRRRSASFRSIMAVRARPMDGSA